MKIVLLVVFSLALSLPLTAQVPVGLDNHSDRGEEFYRLQRYGDAYDEFTKAVEQCGRKDAVQIQKLKLSRALSAYEAGFVTAADLLRDYVADYPSSSGEPKAIFALGDIYFGKGEYILAAEQFARVNPKMLSKSLKDEYNFKTGYAEFMQEHYDAAISSMAKVDFTGEYYSHAQYVMGYSEYRKGDYVAAKRYFTFIIDHESYKTILPFYFIQIEFNDGNYHYVREHGGEVLRMATGNRQVELNRMIGESWFHTGGWGEASQYLKSYEQLGGNMAREENYMIGFSGYMQGKYDVAELYLNRSAGPDDKLSQNASYHLADAYLRNGKKHKAMQSFAIASTSGYDDAISEDALFNYGKLQYELGGGYFNEAINVLNRYIETYPTSGRVPEVRECLAAAYYNSRNYDAAYQAIMQVSNPDNNMRAAIQKIAYFRALEYYKEGDLDAAEKLLQQSLDYKYNAKYTALTGYWQGELLYRKGNLESAADKLEAYIRLSPKNEAENLWARYGLGYVCFDNKDWPGAKKWFDQFLTDYKGKDCYRADALNRRGDAEAAGRSFWKAIEYYDDAAKLGTPERYYSAFQRAMMLGMVQRPERKIESLFEIARKKEGPYVAEAMYELGSAYIAQQRYSEAVSILESFSSDYPSSPFYAAALNELGLAYQNLNNNTKALATYKKVMEREKNSEASRSAMNGIRTIYVEDNNVDAYFNYAKQVGVVTDIDELQRDSLAFVAAQKVYTSGDTKRAATALDGYLASYPKGSYSGEAIYFAGENALAAKNQTKAFGYYQRLSKMANNDFTERGLERLGSVGLSLEKYDQAADAYRKLIKMATTPSKRDDALGGYIKATAALGNEANTITAADEVLVYNPSTAVKRQAQYAKASALRKTGRNAEALPLFTLLSADVSSIEGAESAYRVVEAAKGNKAKVEKLVYDFADKNSPYSYWLGRAFIILGDAYASSGDSFQARATYQSVVDGYPNTTDGVVTDAKGRIAALK